MSFNIVSYNVEDISNELVGIFTNYGDARAFCLSMKQRLRILKLRGECVGQGLLIQSRVYSPLDGRIRIED